MRKYSFYIRRTHDSGYERFSVHAPTTWDAINQLPECIDWDFSIYQVNAYPAEDGSAAPVGDTAEGWERIE